MDATSAFWFGKRGDLIDCVGYRQVELRSNLGLQGLGSGGEPRDLTMRGALIFCILVGVTVALIVDIATAQILLPRGQVFIAVHLSLFIPSSKLPPRALKPSSCRSWPIVTSMTTIWRCRCRRIAEFSVRKRGYANRCRRRIGSCRLNRGLISTFSNAHDAL